jgi:hypothetical protein
MDQALRPELSPDPGLLRLLEHDEQLRVSAKARDSILALTDRRLIVADERRLALDVAIDHIRRVQFDIERSRPATLVIVPEEAADEPQVLAIEPDQYLRAAEALAFIGQRLAELE